MKEEGRPAARDLAVAALARREHSRFELQQKLVARGLEPVHIASALDALEAEGLLDDKRFAEAYFRQRATRGYGPRRIAEELRKRGVSDELIACEIGSGEHDWEDLASAARCKKFKAKPGSFKERARQTRFMEYRGFNHDHIRYALEHALDDEDL